MITPVFSSKDFKPEALSTFFRDIPNREEKIQVIKNWQKAILNGTVERKKEEQLKGEFLDKFFGQVLGYVYESHEREWNLEKEFKSITDSKRPDAALGFFDNHGKENVRCVIEVKGGLANLDKKQNRADFQGSAVDQAFSYVPRMPGKCDWVIVTNMIEIRLYSRSDIGRYESFLIPDLLLNDNLQRFFFLLNVNQLFLETADSRIDQIYLNRQAEQKQITTEFYWYYKDIRNRLFYNLQRENKAAKPKDLFRLTQKLIDRLIFIGFVRDLRLVDNVLTELSQNIKTSFRKDNQKAWGELKELFNALNDGYTERNIPPFNGELFKPDSQLDALTVRDHQLMELIKLVQDYDFHSQLDVNILGHIFEQSVADLPEIQQFIQQSTPLEVPELKPETTGTTKRKKEGIFYTPDYITRYIVQQAVGGWLDDRKQEILAAMKVSELPEPEFDDYATIKLENGEVQANVTIMLNLRFWREYEKKLSAIKVLDPACGSGAFLNQVFDFLYNQWAREVNPELKKLTTPPDKQKLQNGHVSEPLGFTYGADEEWRLKKSIILNNIYGVDLNGESVEITKLSLWLKTANKTNSLATLYDNIKQGNSLIDDSKVAGDDAFNWNKAFSEIMKAGGFDVVVGNPPYVRAELLGEDQIKFFKKDFSVFNPSLDLFGYFYEKAFSLIRENGALCFISNSFNKTASAESLRSFLQNKTALETIIDFNQLQVFDGATTYPVIICLRKTQPTEQFNFLKLENRQAAEATLYIAPFQKILLSDLNETNWGFEPKAETEILDKIKVNKTLADVYGKCYYGIKTGLNEAFITENFNDVTDKEHLKWVYEGKDIQKWITGAATKKLILFKSSWTRTHYKSKKEIKEREEFQNAVETDFPEIFEHLIKFETSAATRADQGNFWWELRSCAYYNLFSSPKIIFPNLQNTNKFCFDDGGVYLNAPAVFLPVPDLTLLAILNSKLIWFFLKRTCVMRSGGYIEVKPQYFEQIPLKKLTTKQREAFTAQAEVIISRNKSISNQSQKFLDLLQSNFKFEATAKLKKWYELEFIELIGELEKAGAKIPPKKQGEWLDLFKTEKAAIKNNQAEIEKTDKEIDRLVYQFYGLTAQEIAIVEKG